MPCSVADRRAVLVLLEPVAVAITPVVDPGQATLSDIDVLIEKVAYRQSRPRSMQRRSDKARGVSDTLIRRVRDQPEMRELAVAQPRA